LAVVIGRRFLVLLVSLLSIATVACTDQCEQRLGEYPPDHIVVTGTEAVDVPHIGWECPDFHSDTIEPPPSVAPDGDGNLLVEVEMEAGSTIDVRFGNHPTVVVPAPVEGPNTWLLHVPSPSEPLVIRLCSADEACALYWVNTYGA
jgi:hypothetical protein